MFYIKENEKIVLFDADKEKLQRTLLFMPQYADLQIKRTTKEIVEFEGQFYFADDEEYIEKKAIAERQRIDGLFLTPSDVERALYKAKQMDFEDLKALIAEQIPQIDLKALAIEFRANNFYRGVVVNGVRLIDMVGALLGYTSDDMDYLFENKELPEKE